MRWSDETSLPVRWRAFGEAVVAARPEWEPFVLGAVAAYDGYGENDVRFVVEIPSVHPTIPSPLVAEIADPEHQGHIDVRWGAFFRHVGRRRFSQDAQVAQAIELMEGIVEERWIIAERREAGRRTHMSLLRPPLIKPIEELGAALGGSLAVWSWRGTYDETWPSEGG